MPRYGQPEQKGTIMGNCLVAQSGGPTAVINASLAGVIRANQLNPIYDRVFGGLYGIEGGIEGGSLRPYSVIWS